jgi:hypothetical protein
MKRGRQTGSFLLNATYSSNKSLSDIEIINITRVYLLSAILTMTFILTLVI